MKKKVIEMIQDYVHFEDNELEIALVTFNRPLFVKEWISKNICDINKRNIKLSVYDSSTNDETLNIISDFNKSNSMMVIGYKRIDSSTSIGYKPIIPMLETRSKYIWIAGDSRYHDFNQLDKKVFPYIKNEIDWVLLHIVNNDDNDGKVYSNQEELLKECFVSMTCIGLSIYKSKVLKNFYKNKEELKKSDLLFKSNYAFAWLGYYLTAYSSDLNFKTLFSKVSIFDISPQKKVQQWRKRFLESWIDDLCGLLDNLPSSYGDINDVVKTTWQVLKLDDKSTLRHLRAYGDLNFKNIKKYRKNGNLLRVTDKSLYFKFLCFIPRFLLRFLLSIRK